MTKYIALLRGINIGGRRKIIMSDLRKLLQSQGFDNVQTYIQSGNIVFDCNQDNISSLADKIANAIQQEFGFEVPVLVRSTDDWNKMINSNPYYLQKDVPIEKLHVTMLKTPVPKEQIDACAASVAGNDVWHAHGQDIFICCHGPYHQTKLGNTFFEKKLKTEATTRTWKTVLKIAEMCR
ncbi:MAG: DUF1697 domain-containing protein [Carboxylicivirga sp.]|jgi:uncharacterized protein (DUF1697 family)|nr:DUF1697 domain-containing protein [Carboxylicivirga sp.]